MATRVRSYSKINLGLAIGPARPDGFHSLLTLYQTLALHDMVSVSAKLAGRTRILLQSNDSRVPTDARNTAIRMVEKALARLGRCAEVEIHIRKNLPIQGGMGAGSANAAAALIGLERELDVEVEGRLDVAAEIGSDVPLFLVGGAVLGTNRGERVTPAPALRLGNVAEIHTVIATPRLGVSTPQAFRDWDRHLLSCRNCATLEKLRCTFASVFGSGANSTSGMLSAVSENEAQRDLAENSLLSLVHAGIENDFEEVVFLEHPSLRVIKEILMGVDSGQQAAYAALSGSGSALFGLYRSQADAQAAQQRVQEHGTSAMVTTTLPRELYWANMMAE